MEEQELEDEKLSTKAVKVGSLFQIMFYNIHTSYQGTPLHVMKVAKVYEKSKSCELTASFNKSDCYNTMKRYRSDLAKYAVVSGQRKEKCGPSESFSPIEFYCSSF